MPRKYKSVLIVVGLTLLLVFSFKMISNDEAHNSTQKFDHKGLSQPLFVKGAYDNPWSTWKSPAFTDVLRWSLTVKDNTRLPTDRKVLDQTLPVRSITDEEIKKFCEQDTTNKFKVIWIGHSTSLINFENKLIIMDPVFSNRASPVQFAGPARFRPVPITIDRIPKLDAVILSHNHYDHLDIQSVKALNEKFGKDEKNPLNWFVGKGHGEWFKSTGIEDNVHELTWWESKKFKDLEFVFLPAQHWSTRGPNTKNVALWGGWAILGKTKRVYFAGDTGYCPVFKEIGKMYGPFDYSFIPIGAYEPRWFMSPQHVDPEEAVQIHMDVKSNKTFAIHWGTFALANEFYLEPKQKLSEALEKFSLDKDNFITLNHGDLYEF